MEPRICKTIALTLALIAAMWAENTLGGFSPHVESSMCSANGPISGEKLNVRKEGSADQMMEHLRALMTDLAKYNLCDRIRGQYIPLSSGGSSSDGGKSANTGVIRIDSCSTGEVGSRHLRIDLSGIGWQWISRKREKLGATFTVNDYVTFDVKISMAGTFDMAYDKGDHILTVWFVPTQPVDANLRVLGDVNVDTESLWSSIVGIAGSLIGKSPEQRAKRTISKKGDRLFRSKLSQGMTLILDLCTGRHYFKLGTFPAGQLPESAVQGRKYLVNSKGIIHEGGMLMAGPFDSEKPVVARISSTEGIAEASLLCEDSAKKVADAYVNGKALPEVKTLAEGTAQPGMPVTLRVNADPGCKVVMVMVPPKGQKGASVFSYMAYNEGDKPRPFVDCSR